MDPEEAWKEVDLKSDGQKSVAENVDPKEENWER